ncbi:hypothetical protein BC351_28380 [Paenibacillus ferrarius]|uniref:Uncharacterized protein n=2 Tax=Paenibacillus ferrarius TaxID=1469647 RepID=A0A1V4HJM3_9BACL|nr:hypothetical protein BC351_28380 [Paenibacillus ferrarius]
MAGESRLSPRKRRARRVKEAAWLRKQAEPAEKAGLPRERGRIAGESKVSQRKRPSRRVKEGAWLRKQAEPAEKAGLPRERACMAAKAR